jgi:hypothetical protein
VEILLRAIKHAKVPEVIKESKTIFDFLLQIFDLRRQNGGNISENDIIKIESLGSSTFLSLVLKINDETLKPLLFRLIDWATIDLTKGKNQPDVARSIAMYKVFGALLRHLQVRISGFHVFGILLLNAWQHSLDFGCILLYSSHQPHRHNIEWICRR